MDNINNNNKNNNNPNRSQATTSSSTDFVLQWGNRKRLRCMKQQQLTKDKELPVGQRSITARGDRRIANKDSLSNGYINLRQRSSSSPAHRVLRNCESTIGMKSGHQSNGDNKRNNSNKNNGGGNGSGGSSETGAKSSGNDMMVWPPKFAIGLTNKEKEEDFLAIKGSKLPQRPKKRAKFIQRTINAASLWGVFGSVLVPGFGPWPGTKCAIMSKPQGPFLQWSGTKTKPKTPHREAACNFERPGTKHAI